MIYPVTTLENAVMSATSDVYVLLGPEVKLSLVPFENTVKYKHVQRYLTHITRKIHVVV